MLPRKAEVVPVEIVIGIRVRRAVSLERGVVLRFFGAGEIAGGRTVMYVLYGNH